MRPRYEKPEDLAAEHALAQALFSGRDVLKLNPAEYRIDFAVFSDKKLQGWVECKRRHVSRDHYPTLLISAAKLWKGSEFAQKSGYPFALVIGWTDLLGWLKVEELEWPIVSGGRTDRHDQFDVEPCFEIPIHADAGWRFTDLPQALVG